MKRVVIGAHLRREDVESEADALPAGSLFLSGFAVADDQPLGDRELLLRVAGVPMVWLRSARVFWPSITGMRMNCPACPRRTSTVVRKIARRRAGSGVPFSISHSISLLAMATPTE